MGLKNMSLTANGTVSVTGGAAVVYADDGVTIQNGVHLIVPADANYQTRRSATVKYRPPSFDVKTSTFGKDKKTVSMTFPILVDGQVKFNTFRLEREIHPATTAEQAAEINSLAAQILTSSGPVGFWATGSLS